jgi:hypothetical protein
MSRKGKLPFSRPRNSWGGGGKPLYINHLATKNGRESRTQVAAPPIEIIAFGRMPVAAGASFSFYAVPQNGRKNLRAKNAGCLFGRTSSFSGEITSKSRTNMWEDFFISQEMKSNSQEFFSKKIFFEKNSWEDKSNSWEKKSKKNFFKKNSHEDESKKIFLKKNSCEVELNSLEIKKISDVFFSNFRLPFLYSIVLTN